MKDRFYFQFNNKKLAYKIYGKSDGFPLLLHHGLVGSSDLSEEWREKADKAGVKIILPERPGYGQSDMIDLKDILSWAGIAGQLLESLAVKRFAVAGISAGAPYAYTLARQYPEKVVGVWIISGVPLVTDERILSLYPEGHQRVYNHYKNASVETIAEEYKKRLVSGKEKFNQASSLHKAMRLGIEANLKNGCLGIASEIKRQVKNWGFDPTKLRTKINLWHSMEDTEVPYPAVNRMVEKMNLAKLHIQKEPSHFASEQTISELFDSIQQTVLP